MPNMTSSGKPSGLSTFARPLQDGQSRPAAIRYLLSAALSLVLFFFSVLPIVSFRTAGGDSHPKSLLSWMYVSFFGENGTKGAYESLLNASAGNTSVGFYRAVVITVAILFFMLVLGLLSSLLSSFVAYYLLLTEEKNETSRRVGSVFRVVFGGRAMTLLPTILAVLPFAFPHLLAYYYTAFLVYHTSVVSPLDPMIPAIIVLFVSVIVFLWSGEKEKRSEYDIFRTRVMLSMQQEKRDRELLEWEDAVRKDAESDPLKAEEDSSMQPARMQEQIPKPQMDADPQIEDDETLYGKEIHLGASSEEPKSDESPVQVSETPTETENAEVMRETLRALFSPEEETPKKKKK